MVLFWSSQYIYIHELVQDTRKHCLSSMNSMKFFCHHRRRFIGVNSDVKQEENITAGRELVEKRSEWKDGNWMGLNKKSIPGFLQKRLGNFSTFPLAGFPLLAKYRESHQIRLLFNYILCKSLYLMILYIVFIQPLSQSIDHSIRCRILVLESASPAWHRCCLVTVS